MGTEKSAVLPLVHAFTVCDVSTVCSEATDTIEELSTTHIEKSESRIEIRHPDVRQKEMTIMQPKKRDIHQLI